MAFSEIDLKRIELLMSTFCNDRIPKHLQDQIRIEYEISGHTVTLSEIRPAWNDPGKETKMGIARFKYTRKLDVWKLFWMRQDLKWHSYDPDVSTGRLEALVAVVNHDENGAFFG